MQDKQGQSWVAAVRAFLSRWVRSRQATPALAGPQTEGRPPEARSGPKWVGSMAPSLRFHVLGRLGALGPWPDSVEVRQFLRTWRNRRKFAWAMRTLRLPENPLVLELILSEVVSAGVLGVARLTVFVNGEPVNVGALVVRRPVGWTLVVRTDAASLVVFKLVAGESPDSDPTLLHLRRVKNLDD